MGNHGNQGANNNNVGPDLKERSGWELLVHQKEGPSRLGQKSRAMRVNSLREMASPPDEHIRRERLKVVGVSHVDKRSSGLLKVLESHFQ